ncbi:MAG TPA: glycosyltransferase family 39 protein [Thermoanaerobaculia bacterium]|jgi:4-amino-4-deoxy-L-arabinose transferase-like glycosyltransferase|nr:glycosyltransferase family 39 protein [Thermoanaerobaculia bacterium]
MLQSLPKLRPAVLAVLLIVIGCVRIASTWRTFSDTVDEITHVGAGLELLQYHQYVLQPENPPLPRVVMAAAPMAGGLRWPAEGNRFEKIHTVMYGHGKYERNLVLMRVGNLVFFILACWAFFVWVRREFGETEAVIAVLLFTMQPIVLGYSGLATFDTAATAGLAVALIAFSAWLRKPDAMHAALLGAGYGFSILMKFSSIGYVPAACAAIYAVRLLGDSERRRERLRALANVLIVPPVALAVIWAGYAFTTGRLSELQHFRGEFGILDRVLLSHLPQWMPLPAPAFFRGVGGLLEIGHADFDSYLFGHISKSGFRWYFPAAVGLKTTLAFFALLLAGIGAAWTNRARRWAMAEALAGSAAIFAVAMPSILDLGVRYVLPAYVPLTAAAAIGTVALLDSARKEIRIAAMVFVGLHIVASLAAHPDYFPYFNALAGHDPGRYLIDSNLDWGQDLLRLRSTARALRIEQMAVNLGYHDYDALGFPHQHEAISTHPEKGWVAVGEHVYRLDHAKGGWSWLDPFPMTRVGMSIRLYYVSQLIAPDGVNQSPEETILLPIAGTVGVVGAPSGIWFHVDQTIQNHGTSPIHVALSACGSRPSPCALDLEPGQTERIASGPGERPFLFVSVPRGTAKQLAFSTVVHAGNWPALNIPALSETDFQDDRVLLPSVPANARLNLRVWLRNAGSGTPVDVRVYSPRDGHLIAGKKFAVDRDGYFANGDLGAEFPQLAGEPVDIRIESSGTKVWAMMTTTDYRTGKIVLSVPR